VVEGGCNFIPPKAEYPRPLLLSFWRGSVKFFWGISLVEYGTLRVRFEQDRKILQNLNERIVPYTTYAVYISKMLLRPLIPVPIHEKNYNIIPGGKMFSRGTVP
jgi:hypothetical protein